MKIMRCNFENHESLYKLDEALENEYR